LARRQEWAVCWTPAQPLHKSNHPLVDLNSAQLTVPKRARTAIEVARRNFIWIRLERANPMEFRLLERVIWLDPLATADIRQMRLRRTALEDRLMRVPRSTPDVPAAQPPTRVPSCPAPFSRPTYLRA